MQATRLFLLRHGRVDAPQGRFYGRQNPPMSAEGAATLERALQTIEANLDAVACSPRRRSHEPAERLATHIDVSLHIDERFAEIDFGDWEGLTPDEISQRWPHEWQLWLADPLDACPAGGEPVAALYHRANQALDEWLTQLEVGSTCLLISHGGVIRVLLSRLLDLSLAQVEHFSLPTGVLVELELWPSGHVNLKQLRAVEA